MAASRVSGRRATILAVAVCALLLGSCSTSPTPPPASTDHVASGQITPLLAGTLSTPRWFAGADDRKHLVYELMLTNVVSAAVTVAEVAVQDAASGDTLMRLTGDSLKAAMSLIASPDSPTAALPSSSVGVVWLDIPLAGTAVPAEITHRLTIERPAGVPVSGVPLTFTAAAVEVDGRPPVVVGAPLAGPRWAALGSCCDGPHRRALYPIDGRWYLAQRFAIDFNLLDAENRPGSGDPLAPNSFPTFRQPAYAVAEGVVVEAIDGNPDLRVNEARSEPTPVNAGGNRVVIDIGDGHFAVYAHLHDGSITVRPGDHVTRGQQIAEVGSSGTTGGPHLHFQMTDRPSVVFADGLPYVFNEFDLSGQTPPLDDVLRYYDTMEPIPLSTTRTGERRDQLPLGRDVVTFPPPDGG